MQAKRKLNLKESKRYISLRRSFLNPLIGITGYLGKTSTLTMLANILESRGRVLKNNRGYGNWNNNINLLGKLSPDYSYALFEFDYQRGNHFGEILRLIKPNIGLVTNIGDAHLNYLASMMSIVLEKSAMLKYLTHDGLAILNQDDELTSTLAGNINTKNIVKFGLSSSADYYATEIRQMGPEGISLKINGKYKVRLPIFSIQDVYNFLAATACARNLDFTLPEIIDIFNDNFQLAAGHGRLHKIGEQYLLDESYIGTPRSVSKAARSLIGFRPYSESLIFIVGDMSAAGVKVEDQHLNMGYFLSALPIKSIITIGEYAKYIARGASLIQTGKKRIYSVNTIDGVLDILDKILENNAVVSIKGVGRVAAHRILKFMSGKQG